MSGGLVQAVRVNILKLLFVATAYTTPTTPIQLGVYSTASSDTAAGTEDTGGSYARQTMTFTTPTSANPSVAATSNAQTYTNMPAVTSTDVNIWDSAGTPIREAWGPMTASKTTALGDTLAFAIAAVAVNL
jgi:hypothetical protein